MIYLGADHGGFALKEQIKSWLTSWKLDFEDLGAHTIDPEDDYPQFAFAVAEAVAKDPNQHKGILACRSAAGVIIAANKVLGVRAVSPMTEQAAEHARLHNNTNVIGLSGDWLDSQQAETLLKIWLTTPFSQEVRHQRRIDQISQYEKNHIHHL